MDKIKIGIPKTFFYYEEGIFFKTFFEELGIEYIESIDTNKEILELGETYSQDEMCVSLKIFLGHFAYLKDKCTHILNLHIDNHGLDNLGCTNYIATKEIIKNIITPNIINVEVDYINYKNIYKECIKIFKNFNQNEVKKAYLFARVKDTKLKKERIINNYNLLSSEKKKILLVGHSYNIHDKYLTKEIIDYLNENNYEIIYSDYFDENKMIENSKKISNKVYWKENKKIMGSIIECKDKVDGIISLSTFPCNNDILVNEVIKNKVDKHILDLTIDDLNNITGIKTRLESYLTIIEKN